MFKLLIFSTFFFTTNCFGQDTFIVKDIIGLDGYSESKLKANPDNIYEDSSYIVSKTCSGEWGGTVTFKNKKTGTEHSAASTCPVVINKLNEKYYVTNTLAHLRGFSEILEISNPELMPILKVPEPRNNNGKTIIRYIGDDESKSTKGTKQLIDSIGILILASFPYKGQLYHIVTDFNKTLIDKIENQRLVTVDTISDGPIWTYDPEVILNVNGHMIVPLNLDDNEGFLDIFENQITIRRKE